MLSCNKYLFSFGWFWFVNFTFERTKIDFEFAVHLVSHSSLTARILFPFPSANSLSRVFILLSICCSCIWNHLKRCRLKLLVGNSNFRRGKSYGCWIVDCSSFFCFQALPICSSITIWFRCILFFFLCFIVYWLSSDLELLVFPIAFLMITTELFPYTYVICYLKSTFSLWKCCHLRIKGKNRWWWWSKQLKLSKLSLCWFPSEIKDLNFDPTLISGIPHPLIKGLISKEYIPLCSKWTIWYHCGGVLRLLDDESPTSG